MSWNNKACGNFTHNFLIKKMGLTSFVFTDMFWKISEPYCILLLVLFHEDFITELKFLF